MVMIDEYFSDRKELLYFLGGLGLGIIFGRAIGFVAAVFVVGYIIWKVYGKKS